MKHNLLVGILMLMCLLVHAQTTDGKRGRFGVTATFLGGNEVSPVNTQELIGGPGWADGDGFWACSFQYLYPLNNWLELETGIGFSSHKIKREIYKIPTSSVVTDRKFEKDQTAVVDFPVGLRTTFLRYFFVSGGCFLGIETGSTAFLDNQTGIGFRYEAGLQYKFSNGFLVTASPYAKHYATLTFSTDHKERLGQWGIKLGMFFKAKK